jgi:hypothetical protein
VFLRHLAPGRLLLGVPWQGGEQGRMRGPGLAWAWALGASMRCRRPPACGIPPAAPRPARPLPPCTRRPHLEDGQVDVRHERAERVERARPHDVARRHISVERLLRHALGVDAHKVDAPAAQALVLRAGTGQGVRGRCDASVGAASAHSGPARHARRTRPPPMPPWRPPSPRSTRTCCDPRYSCGRVPFGMNAPSLPRSSGTCHQGGRGRGGRAGRAGGGGARAAAQRPAEPSPACGAPGSTNAARAGRWGRRRH